MEEHKNCFLCGDENISVVAFFTPNDQRRFGATEGHIRVFEYVLCESCYHREDEKEAAIDKILSTVSYRNN